MPKDTHTSMIRQRISPNFLRKIASRVYATPNFLRKIAPYDPAGRNFKVETGPPTLTAPG